MWLHLLQENYGLLCITYLRGSLLNLHYALFVDLLLYKLHSLMEATPYILMTRYIH